MVTQYNVLYGNLDFKREGDTLVVSDDCGGVLKLVQDETSCWIGTDDYKSMFYFNVNFNDDSFIHNDREYKFNHIKLVVI